VIKKITKGEMQKKAIIKTGLGVGNVWRELSGGDVFLTEGETKIISGRDINIKNNPDN